MKKAFVDSDIIIDLLFERDNFYKPAAQLFSLANSGKVQIGVSSLSFANIYYIISKKFKDSESRKILLKLKTLVSVLEVNDKIIELSLVSDFSDFEDAIQYNTAIDNNYTLLITRNLKDYKESGISVLTAEQFISTL